MVGRFLRYLIPLAVLCYAVLLAFSALFGVGAALIGGIMAVAGLASLLICVLERLTELERKLDQLLRDRSERMRED